jgi:hypothetical protein
LTFAYFIDCIKVPPKREHFLFVLFIC